MYSLNLVDEAPTSDEASAGLLRQLINTSPLPLTLVPRKKNDDPPSDHHPI
jgi:hypothetical protein